MIQRTIVALLTLATSALAWMILSPWLTGTAERFYLLFPPTVLALYLAVVPDGVRKLKPQLRSAGIYVAILVFLCALYNLYAAAAMVPDGTGRWFRGLRLSQVIVPAYFFAAVSLLVLLPLRLLRLGVCRLDERCFGPLAEAERGRLPRVLLREAAPALLTVPLLLPYVMGITYVHRFKMPNTSNPKQVLGRDYEDVEFQTKDGMTIRGWFVPARPRFDFNRVGFSGVPDPWFSGVPDPPRPRTLIICHGLGANRSNFLDFCEVADALEANVLMFDFRGHGNSDGYTVSFGYHERLDVLAALDFLRQHYPEQAREVYGLGISMGSSALLQAAAEASPPFDGIIVDSGFASATELTDNILAGFPGVVRPWMKAVGVPIASLHAGCDLRDVRPIDAVARIDSPILFIHAADDALIPVSHAERLRRAATGSKDILVTAAGGHGSSLHRQHDMYLAFVRKLRTLPRPTLAATQR